MIRRLLNLLFPPKCLLCRNFLSKEETHLCHRCRADAPEFTKSKRRIPFVAQWTGIWYYTDTVRSSILRFKFYNARSYALPYAQLLALRLQKEDMDNADLISWVPISDTRRRKRGYDQGELLAQALARELNVPYMRLLEKTRDTPPQSGFRDAAGRRANVLGAYRFVNRSYIRDKHILLLDDVITTGATASECAKILSAGGAKEITLAAVAVADKNK